MISPVQGSVLPSSTQIFTWTSWPGSVYYGICFGTSPGATNLGCSPHLTAMTWTATNLPMTGITIYVRLFTFTNTAINYLDYTYTGLPIPAAMLTPAPGSTIHAGTATFTWTTGQGQSMYGIGVGASIGSFNLGGIFPTMATTWSATNLPKNGSTIYVRLLSRNAQTGVWQSTDYTYVAGP
jgi:hypothetical protein